MKAVVHGSSVSTPSSRRPTQGLRLPVGNSAGLSFTLSAREAPSFRTAAGILRLQAGEEVKNRQLPGLNPHGRSTGWRPIPAASPAPSKSRTLPAFSKSIPSVGGLPSRHRFSS